MERWARLTDGIVQEIILFQPELRQDGNGERMTTIADAFHADIVAALMLCGDDVACGWVWNGAEFSAPPPRPPDE